MEAVARVPWRTAVAAGVAIGFVMSDRRFDRT